MSLSNFKYLFFVLAVFILTRQVPFTMLSNVMTLSVILVIVINAVQGHFHFTKNQKIVVASIFTFLTLNFTGSVLAGNSFFLALRFFIILSLIILAYQSIGDSRYLKPFLILISLQSAVLIAGEFLLIVFDLYSPFIRNFVINSSWGDVYPSGGLYKIQLKGNALIPLGLFISWFYTDKRWRIILVSINLAGLVISGNFAFLVGLSVFVFSFFVTMLNKGEYQFLKPKKIVFLSYLAVLLSVTKVVSYVVDQIKIKSEGSNPTRVDQINVLFDDIDLNLIWGKGLGNVLEVKTIFRDYTDQVYFEIQNLYILNQIGVIGFILYVVLTVLFVRYLSNSESKLVFVCYLIYSLFNPYVFDTNHIIAILVTSSLDTHLSDSKKNQNLKLT